MRPLTSLALLASLVSLAACSGSAAPPPYAVVQSPLARDTAPSVSQTDATQLAADDTRFAFDMYHAVTGSDASSNLFFSPYSMSIALAMTYAGASGQTAQQMATALHFTLPPDRLHAAFDSIDLALASRSGAGGKGFHLDVADSLWGDRSMTWNAPFLDTLAVDYGSGLRVVDFANQPDPSRLAINGWVSDQTAQKIPDLLPEGSIGADTRFVLVNAIYFNAHWKTQFVPELTQPETFTHLDGSTVQTPAMSNGGEGQLAYAEGSGWQAVELPYDGEQTSMVVVLPASGQFGAVEKQLGADFLGSVVKGLSSAQVSLALPKFSITGSTISIKDQLTKLGMVDAFTPNADFSAMTSQGPIQIGDVLHQAFVHVDEAGTEAGAATAVIGLGSAEPMNVKNMTVDRPFFFFIRDIPTSTVLFVGRVTDPQP